MTRFAAAMKKLALIALIFSSCQGSSDKAQALFDDGKYDEAIKEYDTKLSNSNDLTVRYNRARAYEEKGDLNTAEREYTSILEEDPEHLPAKLSLSKVAYEKGEYTRSIMLSGDALQIDERSALAHFLQARAKHQLGYTKPAMQGYDLAISYDKNMGEAYLYRGALRQSLKRKNACEDFRVAEILEVEGAKEAMERFCD